MTVYKEMAEDVFSKMFELHQHALHSAEVTTEIISWYMCRVVPCADVKSRGTVWHRVAPACHASLDLCLLPWTSRLACLQGAPPPPHNTAQCHTSWVSHGFTFKTAKRNSLLTQRIDTISSIRFHMYIPFPFESNTRGGALLSAKVNDEAARFEFECNIHLSFVTRQPAQTGSGKGVWTRKKSVSLSNEWSRATQYNSLVFMT